MSFPRLPRISPLLVALLWTPLSTVGGEITPAAANPVQRARDLADHGRSEEAITLLETNRALAAAHDDAYYEGMILNTLGLVCETQEKYLEAQKAFDNSIALLTRVKGQNDLALLQPLDNEAQLLYEARQYSQAEALARRELAVRNAIGENDVNTGIVFGMLGKIYLAERRCPQARQCAEDSLKILEKEGRADGVAAALAYSILGSVYNEYHETAGAQQSLERSLSLLQESLSPYDYRVAEGMANPGLLYAHQGVADKAEPLLEKAHGFFSGARLNNMFTREFLTRWAFFEHEWGHRKKAKNLSNEVKALAAASPEAAFSRYVIDASAYR